jgi:hypothetical protein
MRALRRPREMKFHGTIEYLRGQRAAIVTLTINGEWSGSGRIELPRGRKADLYELGYTYLARAAAIKGGSLDRYSVVRE